MGDGNLSSLDNVVPAPTREDASESAQPLECAWTNVETGAKSLVPAPTNADCERSEQMHECAGTYRKAV